MSAPNQTLRQPAGERTVLSIAMLFPLAFTFGYFVMLADSPRWLQQTAFVLGKTIQFGFPVFWMAVAAGQSIRPPRLVRPGLDLGSRFGLLVALVIVLGHHYVLAPRGVLVPGGAEGQAIWDKLTGLGITSPASFLVVGLFYGAVHCALEEYYWRWFVFGRIRHYLPLPGAIVTASLGFTLHHIVLLGVFFGFTAVWTWLCVVGVFIGGCFWCWLYHRSGSLWGPWLGHVLIEVGIFVVGYRLIAPLAAGT